MISVVWGRLCLPAPTPALTSGGAYPTRVALASMNSAVSGRLRLQATMPAPTSEGACPCDSNLWGAAVPHASPNIVLLPSWTSLLPNGGLRVHPPLAGARHTASVENPTGNQLPEAPGHAVPPPKKDIGWPRPRPAHAKENDFNADTIKRNRDRQMNYPPDCSVRHHIASLLIIRYHTILFYII